MKRILIIDDNDSFREFLREVLESAGYEIIDASNGDDGIKLYREKGADIVISDMIMPGKEGLETMVALKKEFPDIKMIAVSGGGFEEPTTYLEGAELIGGALRTFTKPFTIPEILKAIKEILESPAKKGK